MFAQLACILTAARGKGKKVSLFKKFTQHRNISKVNNNNNYHHHQQQQQPSITKSTIPTPPSTPTCAQAQRGFHASHAFRNGVEKNVPTKAKTHLELEQELMKAAEERLHKQPPKPKDLTNLSSEELAYFGLNPQDVVKSKPPSEAIVGVRDFDQFKQKRLRKLNILAGAFTLIYLYYRYDDLQDVKLEQQLGLYDPNLPRPNFFQWVEFKFFSSAQAAGYPSHQDQLVAGLDPEQDPITYDPYGYLAQDKYRRNNKHDQYESGPMNNDELIDHFDAQTATWTGSIGEIFATDRPPKDPEHRDAENYRRFNKPSHDLALWEVSRDNPKLKQSIAEELSAKEYYAQRLPNRWIDNSPQDGPRNYYESRHADPDMDDPTPWHNATDDVVAEDPDELEGSQYDYHDDSELLPDQDGHLSPYPDGGFKQDLEDDAVENDSLFWETKRLPFPSHYRYIDQIKRTDIETIGDALKKELTEEQRLNLIERFTGVRPQPGKANAVHLKGDGVAGVVGLEVPPSVMEEMMTNLSYKNLFRKEQFDPNNPLAQERKAQSAEDLVGVHDDDYFDPESEGVFTFRNGVPYLSHAFPNVYDKFNAYKHENPDGVDFIDGIPFFDMSVFKRMNAYQQCKTVANLILNKILPTVQNEEWYTGHQHPPVVIHEIPRGPLHKPLTRRQLELHKEEFQSITTLRESLSLVGVGARTLWSQVTTNVISAVHGYLPNLIKNALSYLPGVAQYSVGIYIDSPLFIQHFSRVLPYAQSIKNENQFRYGLRRKNVPIWDKVREEYYQLCATPPKNRPDHISRRIFELMQDLKFRSFGPRMLHQPEIPHFQEVFPHAESKAVVMTLAQELPGPWIASELRELIQPNICDGRPLPQFNNEPNYNDAGIPIPLTPTTLGLHSYRLKRQLLRHYKSALQYMEYELGLTQDEIMQQFPKDFEEVNALRKKMLFSNKSIRYSNIDPLRDGPGVDDKISKKNKEWAKRVAAYRKKQYEKAAAERPFTAKIYDWAFGTDSTVLPEELQNSSFMYEGGTGDLFDHTPTDVEQGGLDEETYNQRLQQLLEEEKVDIGPQPISLSTTIALQSIIHIFAALESLAPHQTLSFSWGPDNESVILRLPLPILHAVAQYSQHPEYLLTQELYNTIEYNIKNGFTPTGIDFELLLQHFGTTNQEVNQALSDEHERLTQIYEKQLDHAEQILLEQEREETKREILYEKYIRKLNPIYNPNDPLTWQTQGEWQDKIWDIEKRIANGEKLEDILKEEEQQGLAPDNWRESIAQVDTLLAKKREEGHPRSLQYREKLEEYKASLLNELYQRQTTTSQLLQPAKVFLDYEDPTTGEKKTIPFTTSVWQYDDPEQLHQLLSLPATMDSALSRQLTHALLRYEQDHIKTKRLKTNILRLLPPDEPPKGLDYWIKQVEEKRKAQETIEAKARELNGEEPIPQPILDAVKTVHDHLVQGTASWKRKQQEDNDVTPTANVLLRPTFQGIPTDDPTELQRYYESDYHHSSRYEQYIRKKYNIPKDDGGGGGGQNQTTVKSAKELRELQLNKEKKLLGPPVPLGDDWLKKHPEHRPGFKELQKEAKRRSVEEIIELRNKLKKRLWKAEGFEDLYIAAISRHPFLHAIEMEDPEDVELMGKLNAIAKHRYEALWRKERGLYTNALNGDSQLYPLSDSTAGIGVEFDDIRSMDKEYAVAMQECIIRHHFRGISIRDFPQDTVGFDSTKDGDDQRPVDPDGRPLSKKTRITIIDGIHDANIAQQQQVNFGLNGVDKDGNPINTKDIPRRMGLGESLLLINDELNDFTLTSHEKIQHLKTNEVVRLQAMQKEIDTLYERSQIRPKPATRQRAMKDFNNKLLEHRLHVLKNEIHSKTSVLNNNNTTNEPVIDDEGRDTRLLTPEQLKIYKEEKNHRDSLRRLLLDTELRFREELGQDHAAADELRRKQQALSPASNSSIFGALSDNPEEDRRKHREEVYRTSTALFQKQMDAKDVVKDLKKEYHDKLNQDYFKNIASEPLSTSSTTNQTQFTREELDAIHEDPDLRRKYIESIQSMSGLEKARVVSKMTKVLIDVGPTALASGSVLAQLEKRRQLALQKKKLYATAHKVQHEHHFPHYYETNNNNSSDGDDDDGYDWLNPHKDVPLFNNTYPLPRRVIDPDGEKLAHLSRKTKQQSSSSSQSKKETKETLEKQNIFNDDYVKRLHSDMKRFNPESCQYDPNDDPVTRRSKRKQLERYAEWLRITNENSHPDNLDKTPGRHDHHSPYLQQLEQLLPGMDVASEVKLPLYDTKLETMLDGDIDATDALLNPNNKKRNALKAALSTHYQFEHGYQQTVARRAEQQQQRNSKNGKKSKMTEEEFDYFLKQLEYAMKGNPDPIKAYTDKMSKHTEEVNTHQLAAKPSNIDSLLSQGNLPILDHFEEMMTQRAFTDEDLDRFSGLIQKYGHLNPRNKVLKQHYENRKQELAELKKQQQLLLIKQNNEEQNLNNGNNTNGPKKIIPPSQSPISNPYQFDLHLNPSVINKSTDTTLKLNSSNVKYFDWEKDDEEERKKAERNRIPGLVSLDGNIDDDDEDLKSWDLDAPLSKLEYKPQPDPESHRWDLKTSTEKQLFHADVQKSLDNTRLVNINGFDNTSDVGNNNNNITPSLQKNPKTGEYVVVTNTNPLLSIAQRAEKEGTGVLKDNVFVTPDKTNSQTTTKKLEDQYDYVLPDKKYKQPETVKDLITLYYRHAIDMLNPIYQNHVLHKLEYLEDIVHTPENNFPTGWYSDPNELHIYTFNPTSILAHVEAALNINPYLDINLELPLANTPLKLNGLQSDGTILLSSEQRLDIIDGPDHDSANSASSWLNKNLPIKYHEQFKHLASAFVINNPNNKYGNVDPSDNLNNLTITERQELRLYDRQRAIRLNDQNTLQTIFNVDEFKKHLKHHYEDVQQDLLSKYHGDFKKYQREHPYDHVASEKRGNTPEHVQAYHEENEMYSGMKQGIDIQDSDRIKANSMKKKGSKLGLNEYQSLGINPNIMLEQEYKDHEYERTKGDPRIKAAKINVLQKMDNHYRAMTDGDITLKMAAQLSRRHDREHSIQRQQLMKSKNVAAISQKVVDYHEDLMKSRLNKLIRLQAQDNAVLIIHDALLSSAIMRAFMGYTGDLNNVKISFIQNKLQLQYNHHLNELNQLINGTHNRNVTDTIIEKHDKTFINNPLNTTELYHYIDSTQNNLINLTNPLRYNSGSSSIHADVVLPFTREFNKRDKILNNAITDGSDDDDGDGYNDGMMYSGFGNDPFATGDTIDRNLVTTPLLQYKKFDNFYRSEESFWRDMHKPSLFLTKKSSSSHSALNVGHLIDNNLFTNLNKVWLEWNPPDPLLPPHQRSWFNINLLKQHEKLQASMSKFQADEEATIGKNALNSILSLFSSRAEKKSLALLHEQIQKQHAEYGAVNKKKENKKNMFLLSALLDDEDDESAKFLNNLLSNNIRSDDNDLFTSLLTLDDNITYLHSHLRATQPTIEDLFQEYMDSLKHPKDSSIDDLPNLNDDLKGPQALIKKHFKSYDDPATPINPLTINILHNITLNDYEIIDTNIWGQRLQAINLLDAIPPLFIPMIINQRKRNLYNSQTQNNLINNMKNGITTSSIQNDDDALKKLLNDNIMNDYLPTDVVNLILSDKTIYTPYLTKVYNFKRKKLQQFAELQYLLTKYIYNKTGDGNGKDNTTNAKNIFDSPAFKNNHDKSLLKKYQTILDEFVLHDIMKQAYRGTIDPNATQPPKYQNPHINDNDDDVDDDEEEGEDQEGNNNNDKQQQDGDDGDDFIDPFVIHPDDIELDAEDMYEAYLAHAIELATNNMILDPLRDGSKDQTNPKNQQNGSFEKQFYKEFIKQMDLKIGINALDEEEIDDDVKWDLGYYLMSTALPVVVNELSYLQQQLFYDHKQEQQHEKEMLEILNNDKGGKSKKLKKHGDNSDDNDDGLFFYSKLDNKGKRSKKKRHSSLSLSDKSSSYYNDATDIDDDDGDEDNLLTGHSNEFKRTTKIKLSKNIKTLADQDNQYYQDQFALFSASQSEDGFDTSRGLVSPSNQTLDAQLKLLYGKLNNIRKDDNLYKYKRLLMLSDDLVSAYGNPIDGDIDNDDDDTDGERNDAHERLKKQYKVHVLSEMNRWIENPDVIAHLNSLNDPYKQREYIRHQQSIFAKQFRQQLRKQRQRELKNNIKLNKTKFLQQHDGIVDPDELDNDGLDGIFDNVDDNTDGEHRDPNQRRIDPLNEYLIGAQKIKDIIQYDDHILSSERRSIDDNSFNDSDVSRRIQVVPKLDKDGKTRIPHNTQQSGKFYYNGMYKHLDPNNDNYGNNKYDSQSQQRKQRNKPSRAYDSYLTDEEETASSGYDTHDDDDDDDSYEYHKYINKKTRRRNIYEIEETDDDDGDQYNGKDMALHKRKTQLQLHQEQLKRQIEELQAKIDVDRNIANDKKNRKLTQKQHADEAERIYIEKYNHEVKQMNKLLTEMQRNADEQYNIQQELTSRKTDIEKKYQKRQLQIDKREYQYQVDYINRQNAFNIFLMWIADNRLVLPDNTPVSKNTKNVEYITESTYNYIKNNPQRILNQEQNKPNELLPIEINFYNNIYENLIDKDPYYQEIYHDMMLKHQQAQDGKHDPTLYLSPNNSLLKRKDIYDKSGNKYKDEQALPITDKIALKLEQTAEQVKRQAYYFLKEKFVDNGDGDQQHPNNIKNSLFYDEDGNRLSDEEINVRKKMYELQKKLKYNAGGQDGIITQEDLAIITAWGWDAAADIIQYRKPQKPGVSLMLQQSNMMQKSRRQQQQQQKPLTKAQQVDRNVFGRDIDDDDGDDNDDQNAESLEELEQVIMQFFEENGLDYDNMPEDQRHQIVAELLDQLGQE